VLLPAVYVVFTIGYVPAVICYLCFAENKQDAAERLITISACAIVALLTFTAPTTKSTPTRSASSGSSTGLIAYCPELGGRLHVIGEMAALLSSFHRSLSILPVFRLRRTVLCLIGVNSP
jgi:hypothetical protein